MTEHRISPPRVNARVTRMPRPPADLPGLVGAQRQTGFILGEEVDLVTEGLELEGRHAEASSGSRYRHRVMAAVFGAWSRSWLGRLQALHATEWGDYSSATVLVRAAADFEAAAAAHLRDAAREWSAWLEHGGVGEAHDQHAMEFRSQPFRSGEMLATVSEIGAVYREASLFALPDLGTTALLTASESNGERYLATFGDRDFHLGLSELIIGWLLRLGLTHQVVFSASSGTLAPIEELAADWRARAERVLARRDRCRIEERELEGVRRTLVVNWRREPRMAARRILL